MDALGLLPPSTNAQYEGAPLLLLLVEVERTLIALDLWLGKGSGTGPHPPGAYSALVGAPLMLAALLLSLRRHGAAGIASAPRRGPSE